MFKKVLQKIKGMDISKYNIGIRKDKLLRNCVLPQLGLHILNESKKVQQILWNY